MDKHDLFSPLMCVTNTCIQKQGKVFTMCDQQMQTEARWHLFYALSVTDRLLSIAVMAFSWHKKDYKLFHVSYITHNRCAFASLLVSV